MARATASNNRRRSELIELEFFTSQVWRVPAGVNRIQRLIGLGAAGTPFEAGQNYYDAYRTTTDVYDSPADGEDSSTEEYLGRVFEGPSPGPDYCNAPVYSSSLNRTRTVCYNFFYGDTGSSPATTGASSTGFNKTFPGGVGGPASPVEYLVVPTTAGSDVSLIIPAGGYIKIAYLAR